MEQEKFRESPKIDGITLQVVLKQKRVHLVSASSPVEILSREKKGETTVLKISNGFAPLNSITVDCSDIFFSRLYRLYDKSGKLVSSGTVRRLETATFRTQTSDRVINVPASSRSETWTLELDNGANAELKELELHASGPVYQVRFLSMKSAAPAASGETSPSGYRVFYGGSGHPMPSSEFTDALRIAKPAPVPSDSTLSEQKANPHYIEEGESFRDWSPPIFNDSLTKLTFEPDTSAGFRRSARRKDEAPEPSGGPGRKTESALPCPNPAHSVHLQRERRKRTERRTLFTFSLLDNGASYADAPRMVPGLPSHEINIPRFFKMSS